MYGRQRLHLRELAPGLPEIARRPRPTKAGRRPAYVGLSIVTMFWRDKRFHVAFIVVSVLYQASWIFQHFSALD